MEESASSERAGVREAVRAELEATRRGFHAHLGSVSVADWGKGSGNPAWTVGELLFHMTLALRFLHSDVRLLRRARRVPKLPPFLFNWFNVLFTRWGARRLNHEAVARHYDAAHQEVLRLLETIADEEWGRGTEYPDWDPHLRGYVTLERLFHYPAIHFKTHAEEVKGGLAAASVEGEADGIR